MNRTETAKLINKYAAVKKKENAFATEAAILGGAIKKAGGGESERWRASLVKVSAHVVKIKAHKQLRLYAKEFFG